MGILFSTGSLISRIAVSCEDFVISARFEVVSLPSNPSSNRFRIFLPFIKRERGEVFPEPRFVQDAAERGARAVDRAAKTIQKPLQPRGDQFRSCAEIAHDL